MEGPYYYSSAGQLVTDFQEYNYQPNQLRGVTWTTTSSCYPEERNMSKLTSIAKRLFDEDTKKMVKAGLLTNDLQLTDKGESELMAIVFQANKDALVKAADEIIACREQKKLN